MAKIVLFPRIKREPKWPMWKTVGLIAIVCVPFWVGVYYLLALLEAL